MSQSQEPSIQSIATEYIPPSVSCYLESLHSGASYAHYCPIPTNITPNNPDSQGTPVVLGVDEAGRGPVIGPMIYGVAYLPIELQHSLLAETHHFDDSKVLTPLVRAKLMRNVCTANTDLHDNVGWAIKSLNAQDISAGMLKFGGSYNLNAQAMDATIEIIRGVMNRGVNVAEIFVDTIGRPEVYQKKLAAVFPTCRVVVEKKADSLFPVVSAASVVAKVTRDVSCEVLLKGISEDRIAADAEAMVVDGVAEADELDVGWGSGYPSDARCVTWLKTNADEMFGYGAECRFSWGTVKDLLEDKKRAVQIDWADDDKDNNNLSQYFGGGALGAKSEEQELRTWFGNGVKEIF